MTFPGAEVMKAGFIGDEDFLISPGIREFDEALPLLPEPLIFLEAMLQIISLDISVVARGEMLVWATLALLLLLSRSGVGVFHFPCGD